MKSVPVSVCLAAGILFIFSGYSAWQNPVLWFQCLGIVIFVASFLRVAFFLVEGE
jgi:hypothetical protein